MDNLCGCMTQLLQSQSSWVVELFYPVGQKWDHDRAKRKEFLITPF